MIFLKILFNESVVGSGSALRQNNSSPRMHTWNLGLPKEGLGKSGEDRRRTEAVKQSGTVNSRGRGWTTAVPFRDWSAQCRSSQNRNIGSRSVLIIHCHFTERDSYLQYIFKSCINLFFFIQLIQGLLDNIAHGCDFAFANKSFTVIIHVLYLTIEFMEMNLIFDDNDKFPQKHSSL